MSNVINIHQLTQKEKLLLTPKEAFELTSIPKTVGYQLINSGEWPSIRVGTAIRIPLDKLKQWIDNKLAANQQGS